MKNARSCYEMCALLSFMTYGSRHLSVRKQAAFAQVDVIFLNRATWKETT